MRNCLLIWTHIVPYAGQIVFWWLRFTLFGSWPFTNYSRRSWRHRIADGRTVARGVRGGTDLRGDVHRSVMIIGLVWRIDQLVVTDDRINLGAIAGVVASNSSPNTINVPLICGKNHHSSRIACYPPVTATRKTKGNEGKSRRKMKKRLSLHKGFASPALKGVFSLGSLCSWKPNLPQIWMWLRNFPTPSFSSKVYELIGGFLSMT